MRKKGILWMGVSAVMVLAGTSAWATGVDLNYHNGTNWATLPNLVSSNSGYSALACDAALNNYVFAARPEGGIDVLWNECTFGGPDHWVKASVTGTGNYQALARDGAYSRYFFAAKAGAVDLFYWSGSDFSSVPNIVSGTTYSALANSRSWNYFYAAKVGGGVDAVWNEYGQTGYDVWHTAAITTQTYSALAGDGMTDNYFFAARENAVDLLYHNGSSWVTAAGIVTGTTYVALGGSKDWNYFYGAKADGGVDLIYNEYGQTGYDVWHTVPSIVAGKYAALAGDAVNSNYFFGSIPEPATLGLLSLGGVFLRRRK